MLQREHSAIRSTFIKLPFVIKTFVLSIFEWSFYTGYTFIVNLKVYNQVKVQKTKPVRFAPVSYIVHSQECNSKLELLHSVQSN